MMISSASQAPVARATSPQAPVQQQQPPSQQEPAPGDGIDLTSLDCPYKVAQHPILEPSFQLGIAGAVAVAIAASWGGGQVPALQLAVNSFIGDSNFVGTSYTLDPLNQEGAIKAEGNFVSGTNSGFISGGLGNIMDASVAWNGTFGSSPEALTLRTDDETGEKLLVSGTIGTVPTNLTFEMIGGSSQPEGIEINGTIGDLPYHTETRWTINTDLGSGAPPTPDQTVDLGTMTTRGSIGDKEIAKDYKLTAEVDVQHETGFFHAVGSGVNAGVAQMVSADLAVGRKLPEYETCR